MVDRDHSRLCLTLILGMAGVTIAIIYSSLLILLPGPMLPNAIDHEVPALNRPFQIKLGRDSIHLVYSGDKPVLYIAQDQRVRHLSFRNCDPTFLLNTIPNHPDAVVVTVESGTMDDTVLNALTQLQSLREIRLRVGSINGDLSVLSQLPKLESVSLSNMDRITDATLIAISRLKSLSSVAFAQTSFANADFHVLSKLPCLTSFITVNTNFSNEHWASLRLESLETLVLNRCKVTDAGLPSLGHYPALKVLSLEECNITTEIIDHLPRCLRLRSCYLCGTKVDSSISNVFDLNAIPINCFLDPGSFHVYF